MIGVFIDRHGNGRRGRSVSAASFLFALINISLGIINLLPLLPFDGGHASIAIYEKTPGEAASTAQQPLPSPT